MKTALVTALAAAVLGAFAVIAGAGGAQKLEPLSKEDFVAKAIARVSAEMKLDEKAAKDAKDEGVRRLAQKLAAEHHTVSEKLMGVAKDMKIAVVEGFDKSAKENYDRITRLSGDEFDREYVKHVLKCHEDAINLFDRQRPRDAGAALTGAIDDTLPRLRDHLKETQELAARMGIR